MPSSAEAVCASSTPLEYELEPTPLWIPDSPAWIPDSLEIPENLQIRFRAVAWGVLLSLFLWASVFFTGRALWSLWR